MTHLLQYFPQLSLRPENLPELRSLILQLAVEGKLTAEWRKANPDVEPASELLARIEAEKAALVKAKQIKKSKPLPPVSAEEVPFELPEGWAWCRLGEVIDLEMGQSPKGSTYNDQGDGVPLINGPVEFGKGPFDLTIKSKFTTAPTKMCQQGDLLLCVRGATTGRTNIAGFDACIGRGVAAIKPYFNKGYLNYFMLRSRTDILNKSTGTTFPSISRNEILEFNFPLPPLPEQQAIVQTVDALLQELDQLQQRTEARLQLKADYATAALRRLTTAPAVGPAWEALAPHFRTFFDETGNVQSLRAAILQRAVQGKLTAQ